MNITYEIERKWVLGAMPTLPVEAQRQEVVQAYLSGVRVRRSNDTYSMTVKDDGKMIRQEWEIEIPQWVFDQLIVQTAMVVTKTRFVIRYRSLHFDLDVYHEGLDGLITIEAEWLADEKTKVTQEALAKCYVLPSWVGNAVEVTDNIAYQNSSLARNGLPT